MENAASSEPQLEQNSNTVPPLEAGLVIIATFLLTLVLGGVILLTLGNGLALVFGELIILIVPLSYLLIKRINIRSFIGITLKPKSILFGIGLGVMLILLNIIVSGVLIAIFGVSQAVEDSNSLIVGLSTSAPGLISVTASLALAGICEEFAFRGFLQNALARRYSFMPALLVSSMVFGIFHFDPQLVYIIAAMASGLVLGYINYRWNYVACATAHSTMNLIVLALLIFGF